MRAVNIGILAVTTLLLTQTACSSGSDNPNSPADNTPTSLQITAGDNQVAAVSSQVATRPAVVVRDAHSKPVAGVKVVFSIETGAGVITDPESTTDASGIARVGSWTLGASPGLNSLKATVSGLNPVIFHATAASPSETCFAVQALTIGGTLSDALSASCAVSNVAIDSISLSTTSQQALSFTLTGGLRYRMLLGSAAAGSLMPPIDKIDASSSSETVRAIMKAGSYKGTLFALQQFSAGPYSVSLAVISEDNANCQGRWLLLQGVTTTQSIANSDCFDGDTAGRYDEFGVQMVGGITYTFSAETTTAKELQIWAPNDSLAKTTGTNNNATSVSLSTAVSVTGTYKLRIIGRDVAHYGSYTLHYQ